MKLYLNNYDRWSLFTEVPTKAMLVFGDVYDPLDRYVADIVEYEIDGSGYSRASIHNPRKLFNFTTDTIAYTCEDISFGILTGLANGAVIYREGSTDLDSELLGYWKFPDQTLDGLSIFELEVPASGLVVVSNAT